MLTAIRSSGAAEVKWFGTQAMSHTLPPRCVRLVAWTGGRANRSLKKSGCWWVGGCMVGKPSGRAASTKPHMVRANQRASGACPCGSAWRTRTHSQ